MALLTIRWAAGAASVSVMAITVKVNLDRRKARLIKKKSNILVNIREIEQVMI
jgi:hypothetical protein